MTYEAAATALDILLASAAVALLGCAAWTVIHSRRGSTVRLFGRPVRYPRLWAAGAACMGFYALLGLGNLTEATPSALRTLTRWIDAVLLLAALLLLVARWILEYRARRPHGHDQHARP
ncbi:hypothetical protein [Micromonospora matsumotoense]|nr:hypothetical protein [Micromonospora matsumotoense]